VAQPTQFDPPGLKGDGVCSARMCQRPATKRGMCGRCYQRWRKATPQRRPAFRDPAGTLHVHGEHSGGCATVACALARALLAMDRGDQRRRVRGFRPKWRQYQGT